MPGSRWLCRNKAAGRDPVRRRTDGNHPRPGPGRAEPGIRPGAGRGNISTNKWSTAELSEGRSFGIAAAANGNKIFFARR